MKRRTRQGILIGFLVIVPFLLFSQNTDINIQDWLSKMTGPNYGERYIAAKHLGSRGSPAEERLMVLMTNDDLNIRANAALALGLSGSGKALDLIIKTASENYTEARINALISLARIGDKKAVSAIRNAAGNEKKVSTARIINPDFQTISHAALERMDVEPGIANLKKLLYHSRPQVFEFAVESILKKDKNGAVNTILNLEGEVIRDHEDFIINKMANSGESVLAGIKKFLETENSNAEEGKAIAVKVLEMTGGEKYHPLFLKLLEKGYNKASFYAAMALSRLNDEKGKQFLMTALENNSTAENDTNNKNSEIKIDAAGSLARLGDNAGFKALEKVLYESSVLTSAAKNKLAGVLGKIGGDRAAGILWKMTRLNDPAMKQDALESLALLKDRKVIPPLIDMLAKNDFSIYSYELIGSSFDKLGGDSVEPLLALLDKTGLPDNTRIQIIKILSRMQPDTRAFPALRKAIGSQDPGEKGYAMEWAGSVMDKETIPPLIYSLQSGSDNDAAVNVLSLMGKDSMIELHKALDGAYTNISRACVILALAKQGDKSIIKDSIAMLSGDISGNDSAIVMNALSFAQPLPVQSYAVVIPMVYFSKFKDDSVRQKLMQLFMVPFTLMTGLLVFLILFIAYFIVSGIQAPGFKDISRYIDGREKKLYLVCLIFSLIVWSLMISFCVLLTVSILTVIGVLVSVVVYGLLYFLCMLFLQVIARASLKGRAVKVGQDQLPDIYKLVKEVSEKIRLKNIPECYMVQSGGALRIFLCRLVLKDAMILTSKLASLCKENKKSELKAILGNEAVRIRRRNLWPHIIILPANLLFLLTIGYYRTRHYTNDNINAGLIAGKDKVIQSILLLSAGTELYQMAEADVFARQDEGSKGVWYTIFQWFSLKPYAVNRVKNLNR